MLTLAGEREPTILDFSDWMLALPQNKRIPWGEYRIGEIPLHAILHTAEHRGRLAMLKEPYFLRIRIPEGCEP